MDDPGYAAQQAAEAHLDACEEALWAEEELEDGAELPDSPACAPFCGCQTCVVREVLFAAWPVFTAATAALLRAAGHPAAADLLED